MATRSKSKAKKKAKTKAVKRTAAAAPRQFVPACILLAPAFVKVSADGRALPKDATEWEGVYDPRTALIWGRAVLPGVHRWRDATALAAKASLCGAPARAPSIQERLTITDYGKHSPALDTEFFANEAGWEWTSPPSAQSPSDYAWYVYLGNGNADWLVQSFHSHVRAVRAGQPIGV